MLGNYITGVTVNGKECKGEIVDKVRVMINLKFSAGRPGEIGGQQQIMPVPLDAYLVFDGEKKSLHLVEPSGISSIIFNDGKTDLAELDVLQKIINNYSPRIREVMALGDQVLQWIEQVRNSQ